jgi:hypothetical protein
MSQDQYRDMMLGGGRSVHDDTRKPE